MEKNPPSAALLEIGTEELPSSFFYGAMEQLKSLAEKKISSARLPFEKLTVYGTPRRLVLEISGLSPRQPDNQREVRGPAKAVAYDAGGNPTPALTGFLKSQGASLEAVQTKEVSGKPYVFVSVHEKGKDTPEVLGDIFPAVIRQISFPKSMRWEGSFLFGRPIRWIVALFNSETIPFEIAGLKSGNLSSGHRFLSSKPVEISIPSEYSKNLKQAFVIADHETRKDLIRSQAENLAQSKSARLYRLDPLLDEVTLLVEYPTAFLGSFDRRFLSLPQEVLITVMQHHQRYFPLVDTAGKLLPYFIAVRNGNEEGLDAVRAGNEQVLQARFKDAQYFFETDRKQKLLERVEKLDRLVFQKNLGTLRQKVERLKALMRSIVPGVQLETNDPSELERIIALSKCDLTTQMVFELPELQGVMGKEYAQLEGHPEWICQAILDHYLPRFQGDDFPKTTVGALLGIVDRMDTLVGCFGLNLEPSGSSDPLGLRRAATTLVQILVEKKLNINLSVLAGEARNQYKLQGFNLEENPGKLESFILERCETVWKSQGIRYDLFRAFHAAVGEHPVGMPVPPTQVRLMMQRPFSAFSRARFLENLRNTHKEKFVSFVQAWVRVFNILKSKEAAEILEREAGGNYEINAGLFQLPEENELYRHLQAIQSCAQESSENGRAGEHFEQLAGFQLPINAFFDKVLVMDPEKNLRKNRILLLQKLRYLISTMFGDLTQIVLD